MNDMDVYQIHEDPKEEEDLPQQAVDNLLSKELLQLSLKDRTAIQEEIHGVKCLAPEETPELLEASLIELAMALKNDDLIPPRKKQMQFLGIGHGRRAGTLLLLLLMHFFFSLSHFKDYE